MNDELIQALKLARAQLQLRVVQLSMCRVCGNQQTELERAVKTLQALETNLEQNRVQIVST